MSQARILLTFALLLFVICNSACVRRDGRNSDCTWPGEAGAQVLDPTQPSAARHLSSDTEFAEELADRYTNVHFGPRSGYSGPPVAGRERHACMVKLFAEVAATHGVTTEQVVAAFGHNRLRIDLAEILSFAILFTWAAAMAARRLWKRYPPEEDGWVPSVVVHGLCGLGFGIAAFLIGPVWTGTIERLRIGTGHLGPRALRLPMDRYANTVFEIGVVAFWIIAAVIRLRLANQESISPDASPAP